jgi:hypothetical protein
MEVGRYIMMFSSIINCHCLDTIAFNTNGSLFFNLRYFEQVYADKVDLLVATSSNPVLCELINFYFMVLCHELTHNQHSDHSLNFIIDMQKIAVAFMPGKDLFLQQFCFITYF